MPKRPLPPAIEDPVRKMNHMYRWTRHVYDATRRYYLLGRDEMLEQIADQPGGPVLEVGCGTARNLRILDQWAPQHTLYGIDASLSMLATARSKLEKAGCTKQITLGHGLAQNLDPESQLRTQGPFDVIFFSYVLSMIPSWRISLYEALTHLAPDGHLYIVDFWDQDHLPNWMATALQQWLALFDVCPRPAVPKTLTQMAQTSNLDCEVTDVGHRYAYQIHLQRSGPLSESVLAPLSDLSNSSSAFCSIPSESPPETHSDSPPRESEPVLNRT